MINIERFNEILIKFKADFIGEHWKNEKYKWVAVQRFQDVWDINAPDFLDMFMKATDKTFNLLANMSNFPRGMIKDFATADPEFTRAMFINLFDETKDKEKIEIKTKGNLDICLQDKEELVTIKDSSGENQIQLDAKNGVITIEAKKKVVLKAGGAEMLLLDGSGKKAQLTSDNVQVEAKQALKMKGQNTNLEGNMINIKAQGSMKAESSGALQLKGAICKIN